MHAVCRAGVGILALAAAFGQSGTPSFEVAAIKPNNSGSGSSHFNSEHITLHATNCSLRSYIVWAYEIKDYQLTGPSWLATEKFDLDAKMPDGTPETQMMPMLQTLLAERFKLAVHRDTKEMPIYALITAKGGPKTQPSPDDGKHNSRGTRGKLEAHGISMASLANSLDRRMDRPVLDMTGLKGGYDFTLEWDPLTESGGASNAGDSGGLAGSVTGVSIFEALQQQLGLKLEPRKGAVPVIVVDHVEKAPIEN